MNLDTVEKWMLQAENVVSVEPEMPLPHVREIMQKQQLDNLPVIKNGRLAGIITRETIDRYLPTHTPETMLDIRQINQAMMQTAVNDIMNQTPPTITPQTPVKEAAELMLAEKINALPVINQAGMFLGIIRLPNILHMIAQS